MINRALHSPDFWLLILMLALFCSAAVAIWREKAK